jgi:protein gp37
MGAITKIGWTDSTFNGWVGCEAVGPGCDFCYADKMISRFDDFSRRRLTRSDASESVRP